MEASISPLRKCTANSRDCALSVPQVVSLDLLLEKNGSYFCIIARIAFLFAQHAYKPFRERLAPHCCDRVSIQIQSQVLPVRVTFHRFQTAPTVAKGFFENSRGLSGRRAIFFGSFFVCRYNFVAKSRFHSIPRLCKLSLIVLSQRVFTSSSKQKHYVENKQYYCK